MSSSPYIDLSKTQFNVSVDGKYCYVLNATVNNKPVKGSECWSISSDTFSDRVGCMCDAINNAFYGYQQSIGATNISLEEQQAIYNDIVRQFIPFIKQWKLCDRKAFLAARKKLVQSYNLKDKNIQKIADQQTRLIDKALDVNSCGSDIKWWYWLILVVVLLGLVLLVWRMIRQSRAQESAELVSPPPYKTPTPRKRLITERRRTPTAKRLQQ